MLIKKLLNKLFESQIHTGRYFRYSPQNNHSSISVVDHNDQHVHELAGLSCIMDRAKIAAGKVRYLLPSIVYACFMVSLTLISYLSCQAISYLYPSTSLIWSILFAFLPAVMIAGLIAHAVGNFILYFVTKFNDHERRCLALHLPWNRTPKNWPRFFRRWLYCGDWLVDDYSSDVMPYVRAFITGEAPKHIDEELEIWAAFMQHANKDFKIEAGHSIRELACVESLPVWTRDITPGMDLNDLERALGKAGHDWAVNLLRRAATRKKVFGKVDFSGDLHETKFEFHYCVFENGREGLMIVIRPQSSAGLTLEETFSDAAYGAA